ncbi:MAG: serine hydrolase domain-containing protein [Bryobacterales bacterium]
MTTAKLGPFLLLAAAPLWAQSTLDRALKQAVSDGALVGAQAYVGKGGEALLDAVYGKVRPDRDAPVDAETLFCIGSVSKPLASAITLALAGDGKVALEAPVSRYIPSFDRLPRPPTIAQLLAHRGGVYTQRRQMSKSQIRWIRDFRLTLEQAVEGIAGEELIAEPGELFAYSGAGYCVLGRALERASGDPMETLLQRRLAVPLGWRRTTYFPKVEDANVAAGANREGGLQRDTPHLLGEEQRLALVGGSVYSTARELALFAHAIAQGGRPVLSEEAFAKLTSPPFPGERYGYGWSLRMPDGAEKATALRHNGALAASRASLRIDLDSGKYAVVLYSIAGDPAEGPKRVQAALDAEGL